MFILIGSQALIENGVKPLRKCGDIDLITTYEFFTKWIKIHGVAATPLSKNKFLVDWNLDVPVEVEIAWPGSTAEELINIYVMALALQELYMVFLL